LIAVVTEIIKRQNVDYIEAHLEEWQRSRNFYSQSIKINQAIST